MLEPKSGAQNQDNVNLLLGDGMVLKSFSQSQGRILEAERIIIMIRHQQRHVHSCVPMCMYVRKHVLCTCVSV